jgi:hypothetical protein
MSGKMDSKLLSEFESSISGAINNLQVAEDLLAILAEVLTVTAILPIDCPQVQH